jgi:putative ABC transport system permease protein
MGDRWLERFAYRVSNDVWIYLAAVIVTLTVTLLTTGILSMRAALGNPVRRFENGVTCIEGIGRLQFMILP